MQNSKLLNLIKALRPEEFQWLEQFLQTPLFNKHPILIEFYQYLQSQYPAFSGQALDKRILHEHLFPGSTYKDARIRQLLHKMTRTVESFLILLEVDNNSRYRDRLLLEACGNRPLPKLFNKVARTKINALENEAYPNLDTYQDMVHYHHRLYFHPDTPKFQVRQNNIEACSTNLDRYYFLAKLRYACELLSREKMVNEAHELPLLQEILTQTENMPEGSLEKMYGRLVMLLRQKDQNTFFKAVKQQFTQHLNKIPKEDKRDIYYLLYNYAIQSINAGKPEFLRKAFELLKIGLEAYIIMDRGRITDTTFTNIVAIAARLHEFEWTKGFIESHAALLDNQIRPFAVQLAWAYHYFHQQDFAAVLDLMRSETRYLPGYGFRIKSLKMRAIFELGRQDPSYFELLDNELHAFDQYIRRNERINGQRKKGYLNLIKYTGQLLRIIPGKGNRELERERLLQEVERTSPIVVKHWLKEKIQEL